MPSYDEVIRALKTGDKLAPVYLLAGEEPLFIDQISTYALQQMIPEEEREFNLSSLYGADVTAQDILMEALRFPMMGARILVVVREAQLVRDLDALTPGLSQLPQSTCLLLCYKKKPDKRKALYKAIDALGGVYESARIYDSKLPDFIIKSFAAKQLTIDPRTAHLMADATGNDLEKILQEVEKVAIATAGKVRQITPEIIEEYIGVSKEFNNFEMLAALVRRDAERAYRIAHYFAANERNHPIQITLSLLFGFFANLMAVYYLPQPNERSIASALKVSTYAARDYDLARQQYSAVQTFNIIRQLRLIDAYSKGVEASIPPSELYIELISRILAA